MASAPVCLSSSDSIDCDPCNNEGKEIKATWYCYTCNESMCHECYNMHAQLGMTKNHVPLKLDQDPFQEPGDESSKRSKGILHDEVSGRKHRSDESSKDNALILHREVPGRKQQTDGSLKRSDKTPYDEVAGRTNASDESSLGTMWMSDNEVSGRKQRSDVSSMENAWILRREVSGRRQRIDESSKRNAWIVHEEVSERKQQSDGTVSGSDTTLDNQVPGRRNTSDEKRNGNKVINKGKVYSKLATDDTRTSLEGTNRYCLDIRSPSRHPTFSSATIKTQFDASMGDDEKPCYITAVVVIKNLVLLADYHNHEIKAFDIHDHSFVFHLRVENAFSLTKINTDSIAVTGRSTSCSFFALFLLNDFGLKKIREVPTPFWCWGICHHDGVIYVVCCEKNVAEVGVFTTEGKLVRRFEPLLQGQDVLFRPTGIAINHQTGTLYIGDWFTSTVVGLTLSGKVLFNQMPCKCEKVSGVAVDDQGQLYVCGTKSNNVIRMSSDGLTSEVFVRNDIMWPRCLHVHGDELILCCNKSFIVRIYQLS